MSTLPHLIGTLKRIDENLQEAGFTHNSNVLTGVIVQLSELNQRLIPFYEEHHLMLPVDVVKLDTDLKQLVTNLEGQVTTAEASAPTAAEVGALNDIRATVDAGLVANPTPAPAAPGA